jgi:hypothetical protein
VNSVLASRHLRLLAVIEDLDKASLKNARQIFVEQPSVFAGLRTSLIATVPIFLLHSPDRGVFDAHFNTYELPMIKVFEFDGSPCGEGRRIIEEIIRKRIDPALIKKDALPLILGKTAGLLRDVFRVLDTATTAAQSLHEKENQDAAITVENVRYALNRLRKEYANSISVLNLPDEWKQTVTTEGLYERLRELAQQSHKNIVSDPVTMILLKAQAVVEYNGEGWYSVHPLVRELLETT